MSDILLGHMILSGERLPHDVRVRAYDAYEGISQPYAVNVEISTSSSAFRASDCLQTRMLLQVVDGRGGVRYFDGLPDRAGFVSYAHGEFLFRLRLRPSLAALEHREASRIFQEKSSVDVIKTILSDAGVDKDIEWRLRQSYAAREFLCQYRETELDFVHRLLEEEGIFYYFVHSGDGHKVIFADDPGAFTVEGDGKPVLLSARKGLGPGAQPLTGFHRKRTLRPTDVELRDFDFERPDFFPTAAVPAKGPWPLRHFEYPGGFTAGAEGSRKANRRMSALRSDVDVCRGKSRAAGLACGAPMVIDGAREALLNGEYVVTELRSRGRLKAEACENEFAAIPKNAPFSPPKKTAKPKICGVQTAVVTGPSNEPQAIHVDEYGRVKVRFLWDRSGKQDDTSSCYLRVSQVGLGGSMVLPRVGWEVSVAFLDGDPDRPIVMGRTYNAENTPPYALPGASADSAMKSMATPGGAGHNEIKMSDAAGSQGLSISAQKDLNVTTGNDKNETVGVDETHTVGSNYALTVGSNETVKIGANQSIDVGNAFQTKITANQKVTIGANDEVHAKADFVEKVTGTRDYTIGGNQFTISCGVRQQITGDFTRDVGSVQINASITSIDDTMLSTYDEKASLAIAHLALGTSVETITSNKDQTNGAGELHMVGSLSTEAQSVKTLIGGLHIRNITDDLLVKAPIIALGGANAKLNGGGSLIKFNGGPIKLKGSKIKIDALGIVKQAAKLKLG